MSSELMQAPKINSSPNLSALQSNTFTRANQCGRAKKQKMRSTKAGELINIISVCIPWVLLVGKQKLTKRVNLPPKD